MKSPCGATTYCCHCENKIRGGTEAWAKDAEPTAGKSKLCDVNGVIWDVVRFEEVGQEGVEEGFCCTGEGSVPSLPRGVWVVVGEVVHYVGREQVGYFLEEA